MNQNKKALLSLCLAALIMLALSIAAYFIGIKLADMFILAGASNSSYQNLDDWTKVYYYLVQDMGVLSGAILLLWTALTHWGLPISGSVGSGKRWLWVLFGVVLIVSCVAVPYIFSQRNELATDESIPLLFCVCYGLVGYWGGSILVTSDRYQHTPLFARFFR